jgi:hypothetical protein
MACPFAQGRLVSDWMATWEAEALRVRLLDGEGFETSVEVSDGDGDLGPMG